MVKIGEAFIIRSRWLLETSLSKCLHSAGIDSGTVGGSVSDGVDVRGEMDLSSSEKGKGNMEDIVGSGKSLIRGGKGYENGNLRGLQLSGKNGFSGNNDSSSSVAEQSAMTLLT